MSVKRLVVFATLSGIFIGAGMAVFILSFINSAKLHPFVGVFWSLLGAYLFCVVWRVLRDIPKEAKSEGGIEISLWYQGNWWAVSNREGDAFKIYADDDWKLWIFDGKEAAEAAAKKLQEHGYPVHIWKIALGRVREEGRRKENEQTVSQMWQTDDKEI